MLLKHLTFIAFGLSAILLLVATLLPVHAVSVLVQQSNNGCLGCSSTLSVSFNGNVVNGDVIVVGVVVGGASFPVSSLTDSLGSSFARAVTSNSTLPPIVSIYYANVSKSGTDVVTTTFVAAAPAETVYIYELSGVATTGIETATGSGTGSSISVSPTMHFQTGAFLLGIIGTNIFRGNATAGADFTLSTNSFGTGAAYAEYSISGVASPTSFQASMNSSVSWAEDAIALMPT
jgi:hypothetical protein